MNDRFKRSRAGVKQAVLGVASALAMAAPALAQAQPGPATAMKLPAQALDDAINDIASQSGVQIVLYSEDARGMSAPAVNGLYTVEQALDAVLADTGLDHYRVNERTIAVAPPGRLAQNAPARGDAVSVAPGPARREDRRSQAVSPDRGLGTDLILVTARKREESIQDVPGVVTVYNTDALRAVGITDARSLSLNTLGIVYSETFAGAAAPRITIRGVGDDDFNPNGSSSAAVHVNGIFQGTNGLLNSQYFDVERAEVLKGPQGTLYGRNATAGTINIITTRPGEEFGGYLDVEFGNFGVFRGEGAVDLPISERFRTRVAALFEESDGFFEHLGTGPATGFSYRPGVIPPQPAVESQGDFGGADRFSARFTAELDLTASTLVTATVTYGEDESELPIPDVTANIWADYEAGQAFFLNPADPILDAYGDALDNDPFTVFSNVIPRMDGEQLGANLQIDQQFSDSLSGVLLVGYESLDRDFATSDNLPFSVADYLFQNQFSQFTVEARLSDDNSDGFGWLLGAFFLDDEVEFGTNLLFLNSGLWQTDIRTDAVQERSSFGVFASTDWMPVEWFTFEAGVRYSSDDVTFDGATRNLDPFGVFGEPSSFFPLGSVFIGNPIDPENPLFFSEEFDDDEFTWNVGGVFRPADGLNLYAKVSTGYKAGGFDGSTILSPREALPINSETVIAYETGAKYQSPNGVFSAEANLFHYDFEDYQSTALLDVAGAVTNVRANVSDARIRGAEFSANVSPLDGLVFSGGVALLDTEIQNFQGTAAGVEGNELPFSPTVSWNASVVYLAPLSERFTLNAQADISGTGAHFQTINNNDEVDSFAVPNARLGVQAAEGWEVALWVRNFTDERYDVGFFPSTGLTPDTFFKGPPRTYGVNLKATF